MQSTRDAAITATMTQLATQQRPEAPARSPSLLSDIWYYAMPSRDLRPGRLQAKTMFNQPLLFGRTNDGAPFALLDICPHRGIPLRHGRFDGQEVECCYHGWRFDRTGTCTAIPSLVEGQNVNLSRIKVQHFSCHEAAGNLWVFAGEDPSVAPPPPTLPDTGTDTPRLITAMRFPCHMDHAVVGLMDPAHGPFVHRSWWWRSGRSIHAKSKKFGPAELGFSMLRHQPSANSAGYRLLGGKPATEITFRLPGIRIEHITAGANTIVGLTAVTPITDTETQITHVMYWNIPWLTALRPLLKVVARTFINQDRRVIVQQQDGLRHDPSLMLINDADIQAKWYYRLKQAWANARAEGTPFENPVPETTLHWRS